MAKPKPVPITRDRRRARLERVTRLARRLGFVGQIQYRHVYSRSGGAEYRIGFASENDLLVVYAEAFERDADPNDFSLEAIIAHERGHQLVERNPTVQAILRRFRSKDFEEILASLVGSAIVGDSQTTETLIWKASVQLAQLGVLDPGNSQLINDLLRRLERLL